MIKTNLTVQLINMKNTTITILSTLFGSLLFFSTSCAFKYSKSNYPTLISEQEIDDFVVGWIKVNHEVFDWKHASDDMLYSALMHGDSLLSVDFYIDAEKKRGKFYGQSKTMPPEWLKERDKIITFILEKERRYRKDPSITEGELMFPYGKTDKLAVIDMKISDPSIIPELRKNYYAYLGTNYLPPSLRF